MIAAAAFAIALSLQQSPFPDVPANHWAASAVQNLKDAGILHGYPNGNFLVPNSDPFSKSERAKFLRAVEKADLCHTGGEQVRGGNPYTRYEVAVAVYEMGTNWEKQLKDDATSPRLSLYLKYAPECLSWAAELRPELDSLGVHTSSLIAKLKDLQQRTKDIVGK